MLPAHSMQRLTYASGLASQPFRRYCVPPARLASCAHHRKLARRCVGAASAEGEQGRPVGLLIEVDGALTDLHMDGHRQAFNRAFARLGFECTSWPLHLYADLMRSGDGTAEAMVERYFDTVGWPMFLPTAERSLFVAKVISFKQEELGSMLREGKLGLRSGVADVISDALKAGAQVGLLAETNSTAADDVVGSMVKQLGPGLASHLKVFQTGLHLDEQQQEQQQQEAGTAASSFEGALREAEVKAKQQAAQAFVAAVDGQQKAAVGIQLDATLAGPAAGISPAWLAAVAMTLQVPLASCLVLSSTSSLVQAAAAAGAVAVVIPRKLSEHASFPMAKAKMDGYGAGAATWRRLSTLLPDSQ